MENAQRAVQHIEARAALFTSGADGTLMLTVGTAVVSVESQTVGRTMGRSVELLLQCGVLKTTTRQCAPQMDAVFKAASPMDEGHAAWHALSSASGASLHCESLATTVSSAIAFALIGLCGPQWCACSNARLQLYDVVSARGPRSSGIA